MELAPPLYRQYGSDGDGHDLRAGDNVLVIDTRSASGIIPSAQKNGRACI